MFDDYEKRNREEDYWGKNTEFFYESLEQEWRREAMPIGNFDHPNEVYSDHGLLLNFVSQNQYDWAHYGAPARFVNARVWDLHPEFISPVVEWVNRCKTESTNLVFIGPNHIGKTHTALAACRFMTLHGVMRGKDDLYMPTCRMLHCVDAHNILDGWQREQNAQKAVETLQNAPLLLLDDLGAVATSSQATIANIVAVISSRYNANLPTVVTSNLSAEDLTNMYGSTTVHRLITKQTVVNQQ